MKTKKLLLGLVAALALVTVGAGVGAAQPSTDAGSDTPYQQFVNRVARILGKQPREVQSAMVQAREELVDQAVKEGKLRADKAARIKSRIEKTGRPFFLTGREHRGLHGVVTHVDGSMLTVKTRRGDRTVKLNDDTRIRERGQTASAKAIEVGRRIKVLGKPDENGVVHARTIRIGHSGHMQQRKELIAKVGSFLEMKPEQLKAQLKSGKSLAEIAGPKRTRQLIDMLVAAIDQKVDAARASRKIDAERAARFRSHTRERVTRFVNRHLGEGANGRGPQTSGKPSP